jgi:hypothetical protein|tara:strand:- start:261 stop:410 length:150 start_codon:yes stop_codon:yes gene_type:complete
VAVAVAPLRILAQSELVELVVVALVENIQAQPQLVVKQILEAEVVAKVV